MPVSSSFWSKLLLLPLVGVTLATRCPSPELTEAIEDPITAAVKNPTCPGGNFHSMRFDICPIKTFYRELTTQIFI